jgi:hypothetical protein
MLWTTCFNAATYVFGWEDARKKYPDSFAQINMECLKVWCRTKARDATAVDKLKNALQEKERRDIIERIEEIQSANEDCSDLSKQSLQ